MNEVLASVYASASVLALCLAGLAGVAMGALFFGGLWWTTHRAATSPTPALWFSGSLLLRMGSVLWGFGAVANGQWERMLACLVGFVVARTVVLRLRGPAQLPRAQSDTASPEINHAP
ncbi:ATP synthase subunit I [Aquabacterium sp.]|uniref:ATP synthase subunit I n=1 Tax=Aquabacterium sp. TaxID=1872578 RepID=UPI0019BA1A02|nr:ATP synthase subunit I [Aquabacterium sp.]MBC7700517.1 ATP synthase subunit I [Aquabacterium sp.]